VAAAASFKLGGPRRLARPDPVRIPEIALEPLIPNRAASLLLMTMMAAILEFTGESIRANAAKKRQS
jgi:hypothetical protein